MCKRLKALCLLLFVLFCICSLPEAAPPVTVIKSSPETEILIGLIPEQQIFEQITRYTPLANYITAKTGIRVRLKVLSRYGNIIDNFVSSGMDGAFFGSFTYTLAHAKLGVEVIARPEDRDGVSSYQGLLFVRKDSGIRDIKGMAKKRFVFVDKATTAGYLTALYYFKKNGVQDYRSYFRETYFAGTHMDAIRDVFTRKADIGVAKDSVFERLVRENADIAKELKILETFPAVPENGLALRKGLSDDTKKGIKQVLLMMHNDPEGREILARFGASRFIETKDKDYEPVVRFSKEAGINLLTYDYRNE
jgi:phosphonate transport system substrate-binding protein